MRRLKRMLAKTNMRKKGLSGFCKIKRKGIKSFFAQHWREYVTI